MRILLLLIITLISYCLSYGNNTLRIIPQVQECAVDESRSLIIPHQIKVYAEKKYLNELEMLEKYLINDFNIQAIRSSTEDALIRLQTSHNGPQKEGAYSLEVYAKGIHIQSDTPTGIFYGIQTLRQIIGQNEQKFHIPYLNIQDFPAYKWRSFMLDEARYFKGKQVVCKLLDEMARLKMNIFHWHLTDDQGWRIEIKKYPKLTEIGAYRDSSELYHFGSNIFDSTPHWGYYTQKEIKEIIEYAAQRHIQIVPEIEMPGHASAAIAAYPWLGCTQKQITVPGKFGVHYETYHIAKSKVKAFLYDVLKEVLNLFPSTVIHIGGDEVKYDYWQQNPEVRLYMKRHNIHSMPRLQLHFTNEVSHWLSKHGRRMMGWNEILGSAIHDYQINAEKESSLSDMNDKLAANAIVQVWSGGEEQVRKALSKGYDVVNSQIEYTYLDYDTPMEKVYAFSPMPSNITSEEAGHLIGCGCQMWGEFIPTANDMYRKVFPRIAACADVDWTLPEKKDYSLFKQIAVRLYGEENYNK